MNYQSLVNRFILNLQDKVGERAPNHRSFMVDAMCTRAGLPLGSNYCLLGATCILADTCTGFGVKNPIGLQAATQNWWNKVPPTYRRMTAQIGFIGIYQDRKDPIHGHAVVATSTEDSDFVYTTIEFNTNDGGSRTGDGVYARSRNASGSATMVLKGFVDVAKWICDANGVQI